MRSNPLRSAPHASCAFAAIVLLLGYADLARGGITAAPLLLVVGYVIVVPGAILRS